MKLNKLMFTVLGAIALTVPASAGTVSAKAPAPVAPAPEEDLGIALSAGYDTSFLFRGLNYGDNWISTALSLDVPLVDKVTANVDINYGSLADDQDSFFGILSYQRLEVAGGLTYDAGAAQIGLGYRWYNHMGDFSEVLEDGHEVGLTLATSAGPINIGVGGYYDFAIDGYYFEVAVNTEIKVTENISIVPGANVGYALDYSWHFDGVEQDGFAKVGVSIAVPIKLAANATLTPYVAANFPLEALDGSGVEDDEVYGGVSLSVRF